MKPPVAIIDTNVVVSGLISADPHSPTCRILDGMLNGTVAFIVSPALLDEYRAVLLRPTIRKLHGLSQQEIDAVLSDILVNARWREPMSASPALDPGDVHLWALLALLGGNVLVTGDRLLLENPPDFASVLSPQSFLELAISIGEGL